MLVDNKFIFISLPRCASTSFYISCLRNNINILHNDEIFYEKWNTQINLEWDNEKLADELVHGHEKLSDLLIRFGYGYDIISIRRNPYQRFISLWKHIIDLLAVEEFPPKVYNILKSLTVNEILFYTKDDLISDRTKENILYNFFMNNDLGEFYNNERMMTMMYILINPTSFWHQHDTRIKWFEFDKLYELEEWVSKKLDKTFKMEKSNSSQHFDCNLILDETFISKYDSIYDTYDNPKINKTLI